MRDCEMDQRPWLPWRKILYATACAALFACHRSQARVLDLSCDQIVYTAAEDTNRFAFHGSPTMNDALRRAGRGQLIVRTHPIVASERFDASFHVSLTRAGVVAAVGSAINDSTFLLAGSAGWYGVSIRCTHCGQADTSVTLNAGRTDTLDAYLTRFPDNCEARKKRQ